MDGKAFLWEFDREEEDIHAIRFKFKGNSDPSKVGLAFDNFTARTKSQSVPEPASILGLLAIGSTVAVARRKRVSK